MFQKDSVLWFACILLAVVTTFCEGFVLYFLWKWFFVATFAAPPIPFITATGIALTIKCMSRKDMFIAIADPQDDAIDSSLANLISSLVNALIAFTLGSAVHTIQMLSV